MQNCHGLVTDHQNNIILTYQNDGKTDSNCLIKWNPDGTGFTHLSDTRRNHTPILTLDIVDIYLTPI